MDLPLTCPLEAGWQLVRTIRLPRMLADGRPLGGFSAAAYQPKQDRLWLLSDAPIGHLVPWGGLAPWLQSQRDTLRPGRRVLLREGDGQPLPQTFDGEGLVIEGRQAWIASEGRRSQDRRARLIRIDLGSGRLQQELPLPQVWRATPGQGLGYYEGPESLTALGPGDHLLAAEAPLLQHQSADGISLMRRRLGEVIRSAGALDVGGTGRYDGLTELLALPTRQQLLGLRRGLSRRIGSRPGFSCSGCLNPRGLRCSRSSAGTCWRPVCRRTTGRRWRWALRCRMDDRPLVLASDDNFNPLQSGWLGVLTPRRTTACTD